MTRREAEKLAHKIYRSSARQPGSVNIPELVRMGMIPKADLVEGGTYIGYCRNATEAVWVGGQFEYLRNKFGYVLKDFEYHPEDDAGFDVFIPTHKIPGDTPMLLMQRVEEIKLTRINCIEAAAFFMRFKELIDYGRTSHDPLSVDVQTGYDRITGGALFLAVASAEALMSEIDFGAIDGYVFSYEHIEPQDGLTDAIFNEISNTAWYNIAENYLVPSEQDLRDIIRKYAIERDIPVKE